MNGYVKSPWSFSELFSTCAKFYWIERETQNDTIVDLNHVEEIYCMAATEANEIFLNTSLILTYSKLVDLINTYEEENGEIFG